MTEHHAYLLGVFCYSLFECYMGKNKLKANSVPELIWNILVAIYKGVSK